MHAQLIVDPDSKEEIKLSEEEKHRRDRVGAQKKEEEAAAAAAKAAPAAPPAGAPAMNAPAASIFAVGISSTHSATGTTMGKQPTCSLGTLGPTTVRPHSHRHARMHDDEGTHVQITCMGKVAADAMPRFGC